MEKTQDGKWILSREEVERGARVLYCDADETLAWFKAGIDVNTICRTFNRLYSKKALEPEEYAEIKRWSAEYKGILKQIKKHCDYGDKLLRQFRGPKKKAKAAAPVDQKLAETGEKKAQKA